MKPTRCELEKQNRADNEKQIKLLENIPFDMAGWSDYEVAATLKVIRKELARKSGAGAYWLP